MESIDLLIPFATVLCALLIMLVALLIAKVGGGSFDVNRAKPIVNLDSVKAEDNIYTEIAAREHTKAAIANREAAELNLKAEELRSARLKQEVSE